MCYLYFFCLPYCLINIHIFCHLDSRLSGIFTQFPTGLDSRKVVSRVFCSPKLENSKINEFGPSLVPHDKLLTNIASSSCTGECWLSVVFVRTLLRMVRTATTLGHPRNSSCLIVIEDISKCQLLKYAFSL